MRNYVVRARGRGGADYLAGTGLVLESSAYFAAKAQRFGCWSYEPDAGLSMVDPQPKQLFDKNYGEMMSRIYGSESGYRVILAIAYGSDQRGALQAHRP